MTSYLTHMYKALARVKINCFLLVTECEKQSY